MPCCIFNLSDNDAKTSIRIAAARNARALLRLALEEKRAQGMPGVLRARSLACE
jgi:hypothetical protein